MIPGSNTAAPGPRWQLVPGQLLRHQAWGDEAVLYNELSGDTHLVDADVIAALLALRAGPASAAQLCERLGMAAADAGDLATMLSGLRHLSLIESAA